MLEVNGEEGNFTAKLRQNPRYIDPEKCIACGLCTQKCPSKVTDTFNAGFGKRRAAHILYDQTVPLKYAIDAPNCIYLQKGKCGNCAKVCPADAINFADKPKDMEVRVGAVVLAPGFAPFDPTAYESYAFARIPDVVTSVGYERLMSASGPCRGHVQRPSDNATPHKVAWLQCVGSRAINRCDHGYCSDVCCMYALKQAIITAEHAGTEQGGQTIFYMDMRTHGKQFEQYRQQAEDRGVRLVRARPHSFLPGPDGRGVDVQYADEAGTIHNEHYDLAVLSVGMEVPPEATELARRMNIDIDTFGFATTAPFAPVVASRKGFYVCGAFEGPKDIPRSVMEAGAAAGAAAVPLAAARGTEIAAPSRPRFTDVRGDAPRIGVFVCACGINISSVVDVLGVAEMARQLPGVVHVENNMFSCSQDTQAQIAAAIQEHKLNRVVVAACTPRTHEPLFRETLERAGLNPYLFAMANIRNHASWVHAADPAAATAKSMDLVRMAVAGLHHKAPLQDVTVSITPAALIVGGGVAGMTAALDIARQGFDVHLVEREAALGGNARWLRVVRGDAPVAPFVDDLIHRVCAEPRITVHLSTEVADVSGFVGNFTSTLRGPKGETALPHGVVVLASGATPLVPDAYGFGTHPRILTHKVIDEGLRDGTIKPSALSTAVFIQCVGSREAARPWCSRVCCTHTVESALHIKRTNPAARVVVLYRDMRTYGQRELLYQAAREAGVIFSRFDPALAPQVEASGKTLRVTFKDHVLQRDLTVEADLVGLAAAVVPSPGADALSMLFKVPLTEEGWFAEAHAKLRPVDTAADGVFIAGLAHFPKPVEETIAQSRAAAVRAVALLARGTLTLPGTVAVINRRKCVGCGVCWTVCPYGAISPDGDSIAVVNAALCKGCGLCVAACRSGAPDLGGFTGADVMAQVTAMLTSASVLDEVHP